MNQPFSMRSFTSNSSNSAWNSPAQQNFRRSNASGQSAQPSQLDMKIILFPGPNSGLGRLSFSQDQLSSIQSACNQHGIHFNVDEKASNKLPFLNKPGMKIDQLFRKVKELFPDYFPEISTSKWTRIFIHKIDTDQNESMKVAMDKQYVASSMARKLSLIR